MNALCSSISNSATSVSQKRLEENSGSFIAVIVFVTNVYGGASLSRQS